MTFYCARCADQYGLRPMMPTTDFLATEYQREKHQKHTTPSSTHAVQSVFDDPREEYYRETIQEAYRLGALEVTSRGTDVLFCPSTQSSIGFKQRWGTHVGRQDTVRVVKSTDALDVHGFLNASSDHSTHRCDICSDPLF